MNRFRLTFLVALLGLGLTHCGKTPLTDAQRATVKEVSASTNKVKTTAKDIRTNTKAAWMNGDKDPFVEKLENADCEFTTPELKDPSKAPQSAMNFSMGGPKCPMKMEMAFRVQQNSVDMKFGFEITDEELAKLSDVTRISLEGSISGDASGASGSLKGSLLSKKHGEVGLKVDIEGSESSSSLAMTYTFADFEAVLEMETTQDGTTYFLNGVEVTEQEFADFMVFGSELSGKGNTPAGQ